MLRERAEIDELSLYPTPAHDSGTRLLRHLQRPPHRVRLFRDDRQQHARGAVGAAAALFPLAHGRGGEAEAGRKFRLRQLQFLPDCAHIDFGGRDGAHARLIPGAIGEWARAVLPRVARNVGVGGRIDFRPVNRRRLVRGGDSVAFRAVCGMR